MLEYAQRGVALQLVWAGHEPQEFINYFPQWTLNEDVQFYNREVGLTRSGINEVSFTDSGVNIEYLLVCKRFFVILKRLSYQDTFLLVLKFFFM